jgi:putative oxidoreductase
MKAATIVARILLGLVFVVFGSNVWFQFLPAPPMKGPIGAMMGAMFETHYIHIIAAFQVLGGLILLIGRYVPLGLTLLGPIIVNILLIHILMEPSGLPIALIVAALALFLLWRYRANFAGLVKP